MPRSAAERAEDDREAAHELHVAVTQGLGAVLDVGDAVEIHTHSGGTFSGTVEDVNLVGVVLCSTDKETEGRVFFVSYSGIEYAEIFSDDEDDDGGDGEPADDEAEIAGPAPSDGGEDVTPIRKGETAAA